MKNKTISGVLPVVQLPFKEDFSIDEAILQKEVDWLYESGVQGLVVGMVSEVQRLNDAERDALHAMLVRMSAGRGPVVGSVGDESMCQALRHARAAEDAGADALMAIPPSQTRCGPEEQFRYFAALIEGTKIPIVVQDASGYLGNPIPISIQARIFKEYGDRVFFKPEAQPIGLNLTALHKATDEQARIFEGTGGMALVESHRRGILGTMPGADLPWALVKLWNALERGDEKRVNAIHPPLCTLISLMVNLDAFLAVEKLLLVDQGIFTSARVRGPVAYELDDVIVSEVRRLFNLLQNACV
ncbi:MAG: dihydrodipicolinate synthase family protein [Chthoniobacterales bacterium]